MDVQLMIKRIQNFSISCDLCDLKDDKIRHFYHGHEYVDLGLPSGTKWATCNVGAESETSYNCNYYMYGKGSNTYNSSDTPYRGTEIPLPCIADTATQVWGGSWHTPTKEQMQELVNETEYRWTTDYNGSGVNGGLFTSKINGNSVFFPACGYLRDDSSSLIGRHGYYWGSLPFIISNAHCLYFDEFSFGVGISSSNLGFNIRPVVDKSNIFL